MKKILMEMDNVKLVGLLGACVSGICFLGSCANDILDILKARGVAPEALFDNLKVVIGVIEKIS